MLQLWFVCIILMVNWAILKTYWPTWPFWTRHIQTWKKKRKCFWWVIVVVNTEEWNTVVHKIPMTELHNHLSYRCKSMQIMSVTIVPILYMNVILIIYLYNRKSYLLLYSRLKKLLLHQLETVEKHKHFNPFIMPPHRAVWCNSELQNAEERHQFFVLCYLWVSQWSLNNVGPISPAQAVLPCLQCGPLWSLKTKA